MLELNQYKWFGDGKEKLSSNVSGPFTEPERSYFHAVERTRTMQNEKV